ncbi:hypothetical protein H4R33_005667 [Dimargaris cristalligena]|nr:hypothetical protein H4R33_005667 [Dimargaris cristalligena]
MATQLGQLALAHQLVRQFLEDQGYSDTLASLDRETPSRFLPPPEKPAPFTATESSDGQGPPTTATDLFNSEEEVQPTDKTRYRRAPGSGSLHIGPWANIPTLAGLIDTWSTHQLAQLEAAGQSRNQAMLDIGTGPHEFSVHDVYDHLHGKYSVLFARLQQLPTALSVEPDGPPPLNTGPQQVLISSGTDKRVLVTDTESHALLRSFHHHTAPVICLDVSPRDPFLMATGSLDGSLALVDLRSGQVLQKFERVARRFVVQVAFSPDGSYLACATYDHEVHIWELNPSSTTNTIYHRQSTLKFTGAIEALCFIRRTPENSEGTASDLSAPLYLLCGVRHDPYLHYVDVTSGQVTRFSLLGRHAFQDDALYCPFTPMAISVSPCQRYICVSTDDRSPPQQTAGTGGGLGANRPRAITVTPEGGRVILFQAFTDLIVRQFYNAHCGLDPLGSFPRHCWVASGQYILANGEPEAPVSSDLADLLEQLGVVEGGDNEGEETFVSPNPFTLQILEVAGGTTVDQIAAHRGLIRSLWSNPHNPDLAPYFVTASFDGTIIVWE